MAQLDLFGYKAPWGGRSPRALTRGAKLFSFKARAGAVTCDMKDPLQLELFRMSKRAGHRRVVYDGAPLLVPLGRRYGV